MFTLDENKSGTKYYATAERGGSENFVNNSVILGSQGHGADLNICSYIDNQDHDESSSTLPQPFTSYHDVIKKERLGESKTEFYLMPLQSVLPGECFPTTAVTQERLLSCVCFSMPLQVVLAVER